MIFVVVLHNNLCASDEAKNLSLIYSPATLAQAEKIPYFLVEGKAAAKIFLDFSPVQIFKIWRKSLRDNYANPRTLDFRFDNIEFSVLLNNGRVYEIRYFVRRAFDKWFTALGVEGALLQGQDVRQNMDILINHYQKQKIIVRYTRYKNILDFTSLGVRYHFSNNMLYRIDIYRDRLPEILLPPVYKE